MRTKNNKNPEKVLVFGTFDGLHPGHINFLREAKKLSECLVVSLTTSKTVKDLKGRKPMYSYRKRYKTLKQAGIADEVIKGDKMIGVFSNVLAYQPKIIAIGYDQDKLKLALKEWVDRYKIKTKIIVLKAYKPDKYKSSILNKRK